MTRHYALFSGGHDSLVSTHIAMESGPCTEVLHLDTNTGLPENQEYVEEVCEEFGWPLRVEESPMTLEEFSKEYGFPGPGVHSWAYRYFKERQLGRVATETDSKPNFWTGVRKDESTVRMENVSESGVVEAADRWIWRKPIAYFSGERCEAYIEEHGLPRNPVVENIHRSGECYCGAFAGRDEELIDLMAHYPDHADWLLEVEEAVKEEFEGDPDYCYWGHGGQSSLELQMLRDEQERDPDAVLCRDCRRDAMESDWE